MKLIKASVQEIKHENPLHKIELAGRTCYKSDSAFTNESAIKFFQTMSKNHHYAMLEHGSVTFEITGLKEHEIDGAFLNIPYVRHTYHHERHFITLSFSHMSSNLVDTYNLSNLARTLFDSMKFLCSSHYLENIDIHSTAFTTVQVATGVGVVIRLLHDITESEYATLDDILTHKSLTFKFICDRGVSHELVRHRCSVAQESQRYCDYQNNKFGGEITFVIPHDWELWNTREQDAFVRSCTYCEHAYNELRDLGKKPQQARAVLPNATKTEVILTMPAKQWIHFLRLRSLGTTGAPHPDMKFLADQVYDMFVADFRELGYEPCIE